MTEYTRKFTKTANPLEIVSIIPFFEFEKLQSDQDVLQHEEGQLTQMGDQQWSPVVHPSGRVRWSCHW